MELELETAHDFQHSLGSRACFLLGTATTLLSNRGLSALHRADLVFSGLMIEQRIADSRSPCIVLTSGGSLGCSQVLLGHMSVASLLMHCTQTARSDQDTLSQLLPCE